jgi:hypothetical protein
MNTPANTAKNEPAKDCCIKSPISNPATNADHQGRNKPKEK